jgi:hypothetical protein
MERDNEQNLAGQLDQRSPRSHRADNDVFSPGFCSLMDLAFRPASTPNHAGDIDDDDR